MLQQNGLLLDDSKRLVGLVNLAYTFQAHPYERDRCYLSSTTFLIDCREKTPSVVKLFPLLLGTNVL